LNRQFINIYIDNHLNWNNHIQQMILTLSGACYAVRLMVRISNMNMLKSIYCAHFHSVTKYLIIFGGVTLPIVGRFSLYKRKTSQLWLVHNAKPYV